MVANEVKDILDFNSRLAEKSANTSDMYGLVEYIISETIRFIGADTGSIMVFNKEEKCLQLYVSSDHHRSNGKKGFGLIAKLPTTDSISGQVFSTGKAIYAENTTLNSGNLKLSHKTQSGSFLSVPLKINRKIIGVMNLNRSSDKPGFNSKDLKKLNFVDTIIASLVEKENLMADIAKSRAETSGLYRLSCILDHIDDDKTTLVKFLEELTKILSVERAAIIQMVSSSDTLNESTETGKDKDKELKQTFNVIAAKSFPKKNLESTIDSISINMRKQLLSSVDGSNNNISTVEPPLTLSFTEQDKPKELFCFPMMVVGKGSCILLVSREYHSEDLESAQRLYKFLYLVSHNLKMAMEREAMITQSREDQFMLLQNASQNQIFLEISKDLASTLSPKIILSKAFIQFRKIIEFSTIAVLLFDDLNDLYRLIVQPEQPISKAFQKQLTSEVKEIFDTYPAVPRLSDENFGKIEYFEPHNPDAKQKRKYAQIMNLPIVIGDNVAGMIHLTKTENIPFTKHELDITSQFTGIFVTSIKNAMIHKRTEKLAFTDTLTELFNHRYFQETLQQEFVRSRRYDKHLSLMMIDIDYFKKFNDTHGHLVGDKVLRHVAKIFKKSIRSQIDTVARYGGEEFVVILPETSLEGAIHFADRIRIAVEESKVPEGDAELSVTLSIGVSCSKVTDCDDQSQLIAAADAALYYAKDNGRNQVMPYKKKRV